MARMIEVLPAPLGPTMSSDSPFFTYTSQHKGELCSILLKGSCGITGHCMRIPCLPSLNPHLYFPSLPWAMCELTAGMFTEMVDP